MMSAWNTPERRALRKVVADLTDREIAPYVAQWEEDGEIPRSLHEKVGEVGLLELGIPESGGGSGDLLDFLIVNEEMAHHGASSGLLVGLLSHSIATPHMAAAGNADQIERFVKPAMAGTKIGSLAVTEPGGGSDVAALATRAVRDGDHYVVNGAKTFITSGCRADFVTTAVRTGEHPHRGISLLVVEKDMPGFTVSRKLDKLGARCSDTAELSYVDVRVPVANLVGEEGAGFQQLMRRFDSERLTLAVQSVAIARRCLDLTIPWTRDRVTFGQPLAQRQVIRHKLAEMARQVTAARSFVHDVAARYVAGERVGAEIAMAKNTASYACNHVAAEAVQIFGGMGCMRETEVERHFRDARIMGIGGGSNEVMNEIIAKSLGLDKEGV